MDTTAIRSFINQYQKLKDEVDFLVSKERDFAEYYTRRFIDYMCFNGTLFPEYTANVNSDVYPEKDTNSSTWVL
mgnify:CR=1 FL=1